MFRTENTCKVKHRLSHATGSKMLDGENLIFSIITKSALNMTWHLNVCKWHGFNVTMTTCIITVHNGVHWYRWNVKHGPTFYLSNQY